MNRDEIKEIIKDHIRSELEKEAAMPAWGKWTLGGLGGAALLGGGGYAGYRAGTKKERNRLIPSMKGLYVQNMRLRNYLRHMAARNRTARH